MVPTEGFAWCLFCAFSIEKQKVGSQARQQGKGESKIDFTVWQNRLNRRAARKRDREIERDAEFGGGRKSFQGQNKGRKKQSWRKGKVFVGFEWVGFLSYDSIVWSFIIVVVRFISKDTDDLHKFLLFMIDSLFLCLLLAAMAHHNTTPLGKKGNGCEVRVSRKRRHRRPYLLRRSWRSEWHWLWVCLCKECSWGCWTFLQSKWI